MSSHQVSPFNFFVELYRIIDFIPDFSFFQNNIYLKTTCKDLQNKIHGEYVIMWTIVKKKPLNIVIRDATILLKYLILNYISVHKIDDFDF